MPTLCGLKPGWDISAESRLEFKSSLTLFPEIRQTYCSNMKLKVVPGVPIGNEALYFDFSPFAT